MGFHFQNSKHFLEYFGFYTSKRYWEFLFIYLFPKLKIKTQLVWFANKPFFRKMLVCFFSCNILLQVEKNPMENLRKLSEMELWKYTTLDPKFVLGKIKFKCLHYIQHDFIRQHLGLSEDQASIIKIFVINQIIWSQNTKYL